MVDSETAPPQSPRPKTSVDNESPTSVATCTSTCSEGGSFYHRREQRIQADRILPLTPPRNDSLGHLVALGSLSQYTLEGGRSACTSVCLVAAARVLSAQHIVACATSEAVDDLVREGVERHRSLSSSQQHVSVVEVWEAPTFSDLVNSLRMGETFQGHVACRQQLIDAFQAAVDFGVDCKRLCLLLTKSGETVLCYADCTNPSYRWYLFDSHGQSHENTKLAYWKHFPSFHRILDAFLTKYPPQSFGSDDSIQSSMYNLFEAVPIVLRDSTHVEPPKKFTMLSRRAFLESLEAEDDDIGSLEMSKAKAAMATEESRRGISMEAANSPSLKASPAHGVPLANFNDRSTFECAISLEIMADPVVCSDGKVYDRPNIENHFETRRTAEEERITLEEARNRGESVGTETSADTRCGCNANRPPIELTSPITGEVVDGVLLPVHLIEQQIVSGIESKAFLMTDEELDDWHQRRTKKKLRDQERREKLRRARELEEEERQRAADDENAEEALPPIPVEGALRVRVDRDLNDDTERFGDKDCGISVVLAKKENRIPANYARQGSDAPRCMVACCAISLSSNTWCARCARLVCDACLSFEVTSIEQPSHSLNEVSRVCFECMTQVIDVMEAPAIRMRQRRAVLIASLERHLTLLTNRASAKQDRIVHHEVEDEFSGRIEEVEQSIGLLEGQLRDLKQQVRRQEKIAAAAAADEVSFDKTHSIPTDIEEMRNQVTALEREYETFLQEDTASNEDEQFEFICRQSDLSHRLEAARTALGVAESSVAEESPSNDEEELARLQQRLGELAKGASDETFDQQIVRAEEQSSVCARLEELSVSIAMNRSSGRISAAAPSMNGIATPALHNLIQELSSFSKVKSQRRFFWSSKKYSELPALLGLLRSQSASQETTTNGKVVSEVQNLLQQIDNLDLNFPPSLRRVIHDAHVEIAHHKFTDRKQQAVLILPRRTNHSATLTMKYKIRLSSLSDFPTKMLEI